MMIELPEVLKKELLINNFGMFHTNNVFNKGVYRAFGVLVKAGWHSKQECVSNKESVKEWQKLAGWHSKQECPADWENLEELYDRWKSGLIKDGWRSSEEWKRHDKGCELRFERARKDFAERLEKARQQLKDRIENSFLHNNAGFQTIKKHIDEVLK